MKTLKCSIYLLFLGIAFFVIGLFLPRKWFHFDRFPYRTGKWEKGGKLYDNIHIKQWKNKMPDMSRICPAMAPKRITTARAEDVELLIHETCVAELIHVLLIPAGLGCIGIWKFGGTIFFLLWAIGNVPFILIQRYNRPILCKLYFKLKAKAGTGSPNASDTSMKVLILSCNTGEGHNSTAAALKEVLESHHQICEQKDTLLCWSKRKSASFCKWFVRIYRYFPKLFDISYRFAERHPLLFDSGTILNRYVTRGVKKLQCFLEQNRYDLVVCTHMISSLLVTRAQSLLSRPIPACLIATDYTCSPMVSNSNMDVYFIPDISLIKEFTQQGIPKNRIVSDGIPIRKDFLAYTPKEEAKRLLNIPNKQKHLLMMCGSMGCGPIRKLVSEFAAVLPDDVVLTVVCGTNQRLYRILKKKHDNAHIRIDGFVQNISLLMDSADLFLTKPGGISVTEAYSKALPMVFVNAVAGCEDHNFHYFIDRGMAQSADSIKGIPEICISLLHDDKKRLEMAKKMRTTHKVNSAEQIYETLFKLEKKYGT